MGNLFSVGTGLMSSKSNQQIINVAVELLKGLIPDLTADKLVKALTADNKQTETTQENLTRAELARRYKMSIAGVIKWERTGKIKSFRVGQHRLFSPQAVAEFEAKYRTFNRAQPVGVKSVK